jgi:hypothetical protein
MQTSGVNGPGGANTVSIKTDAEGKEVFSTGGSGNTATSTSSKPDTQNIVKPSDDRSTPLPPPKIVEDEDDLEAKVDPGTKCLRSGCKHTFVSDEASRGDGDQSECTYHPMPVSIMGSILMQYVAFHQLHPHSARSSNFLHIS